MHSPFSIHKALVIHASPSTGNVFVKIPSVLGTTESIAISKMNMNKSSSGWGVPAEGSNILVAVEDSEMTNVYLLNPPPAPATTITITALPATIKQYH